MNGRECLKSSPRGQPSFCFIFVFLKLIVTGVAARDTATGAQDLVQKPAFLNKISFLLQFIKIWYFRVFLYFRFSPFSATVKNRVTIYGRGLSREACRELIVQLQPFMPARVRNTGVAAELQILASLNFLASGSYQRRIGQDFMTCMSQTTVNKYLDATVNALNHVMRNWIRFPVAPERIERIKCEFFEKSGFPGVIGAIDGTHIAIFPPQTEREHLFINRRYYHSLNVMDICDYNGEILAVNSAQGGRTHDSRVFRSSRVFPHLTEKYREGRMDCWLLGDSAYPLLPFILTPLLHQPEGSPRAKYTEHHIRTRVAIERCFGVLKGRWRCLRKERALHYTPEVSALIVNACCVLHNMAIKWRLPVDDIHLDPIDTDPPSEYDGREVESGRQTQNQIVEWYFSN